MQAFRLLCIVSWLKPNLPVTKKSSYRFPDPSSEHQPPFCTKASRDRELSSQARVVPDTRLDSTSDLAAAWTSLIFISDEIAALSSLDILSIESRNGFTYLAVSPRKSLSSRGSSGLIFGSTGLTHSMVRMVESSFVLFFGELGRPGTGILGSSATKGISFLAE